MLTIIKCPLTILVMFVLPVHAVQTVHILVIARVCPLPLCLVWESHSSCNPSVVTCWNVFRGAYVEISSTAPRPDTHKRNVNAEFHFDAHLKRNILGMQRWNCDDLLKYAIYEM